MKPYYQDEWTTLYCGDCLEVMAELSESSIDTIITDPPYGLGFMGKKWDNLVEPTRDSAGGFLRDGKSGSNPYAAVRVRHGEDINAMQEWHYQWAEAVLRVAKPGASMLAMGGTRTHHRLMCAIEDAGWEIRDCLMYLYGTGFPKGHDYAYKMHKEAEQEAKHDMRFVRATYLSKAVYACAECGQVLLTSLSEQGASQLWKAWPKSKVAGEEQSCLEGWSYLETDSRELQGCQVCTMSHGIYIDGSEGWLRDGTSACDGETFRKMSYTKGSHSSQRSQSEQQRAEEPLAVSLERNAQAFRGWNVALKPAYEPIILAMKPREGTFANSALEYGVAGLWIDGGRVQTEDNLNGGAYAKFPTKRENWFNSRSGDENVFRRGGAGDYQQPPGRWPANIILNEEAAGMLDEQTGELTSGSRKAGVYASAGANCYGDYNGCHRPEVIGNSGGASRFFYTAKSSKSERTMNGQVTNPHPTVKPLSLMQYLCRLTKTPTGGIILDPFAGSGTTLLAARLEGRKSIGIEKNPEYCLIAAQRLAIQNKELS